MPKIPIINSRKLIKVLKKKGFVLDRVKGSHHIYYNPKTKNLVSVPVHRGRDLGKGIILGILKDAEIPKEEFLKLL